VNDRLKLSVHQQRLVLTLDALALQAAAHLDGCYVVETDLKPTQAAAQTIHDRYKDLAVVERDFRTLKSGHLEFPLKTMDGRRLCIGGGYSCACCRSRALWNRSNPFDSAPMPVTKAVISAMLWFQSSCWVKKKKAAVMIRAVMVGPFKDCHSPERCWRRSVAGWGR
jgi:hypothetical protein